MRISLFSFGIAMKGYAKNRHPRGSGPDLDRRRVFNPDNSWTIGRTVCAFPFDGGTGRFRTERVIPEPALLRPRRAMRPAPSRRIFITPSGGTHRQA
jgi:hypothetical protein